MLSGRKAPCRSAKHLARWAKGPTGGPGTEYNDTAGRNIVAISAAPVCCRPERHRIALPISLDGFCDIIVESTVTGGTVGRRYGRWKQDVPRWSDYTSAAQQGRLSITHCRVRSTEANSSDVEIGRLIDTKTYRIHSVLATGFAENVLHSRVAHASCRQEDKSKTGRHHKM